MIDKSLRSRYQWGGPGGKSPGTSSSGGSRNGGGGGGSPHYNPPAPTPARVSPQQSMAMTGNTSLAGKTQSDAQASVDRDNAMRAAEGKVDVGFQEELKKTEDIRQREKEFLETGDIDVLSDLTGFDDAPKVDVKDIMGEVTDPGSVSYDPTYKTPEEIRTLSQDPNYGQFFRQPTVVEKPKSGIGNILKNVAMAAIPGLLPAKAATAYRLAKAGYDIKQGKGILGKAFKKVEPRLAKFKVPGTDTQKEATKELVSRDTRDGDGPKTIAEQVTQGAGLEEGQKMLGLDDKQIQQIYQGRNLLKQTIESGMYQDRRLNMNEMKMLQGHMMKLENLIQAIEKAQAPVNVAYGGRIDKALGGRSRDIG
jgi:hypothetical protein